MDYECSVVEACLDVERLVVVYLEGVVKDSGWWRLALNVLVKQLAEYLVVGLDDVDFA